MEKMENKERFPLFHGTAPGISWLVLMMRCCTWSLNPPCPILGALFLEVWWHTNLNDTAKGRSPASYFSIIYLGGAEGFEPRPVHGIENKGSIPFTPRIRSLPLHRCSRICGAHRLEDNSRNLQINFPVVGWLCCNPNPDSKPESPQRADRLRKMHCPLAPAEAS
jgi:hypothetical protein